MTPRSRYASRANSRDDSRVNSRVNSVDNSRVNSRDNSNDNSKQNSPRLDGGGPRGAPELFGGINRTIMMMPKPKPAHASPGGAAAIQAIHHGFSASMGGSPSPSGQGGPFIHSRSPRNTSGRGVGKAAMDKATASGPNHVALLTCPSRRDTASPFIEDADASSVDYGAGSFIRTNKESHPVNNFSTRGAEKVTQNAIENSLSRDEDDNNSAHFTFNTVNTQAVHDACELRRAAAGDFVFPLQRLGVRRPDIDRHVDLETLVNLAYMCAGR